jgi:hypothetical protein
VFISDLPACVAELNATLADGNADDLTRHSVDWWLKIFREMMQTVRSP